MAKKNKKHTVIDDLRLIEGGMPLLEASLPKNL
jgi:hypothetical protein